jgi:hypothetical protein
LPLSRIAKKNQSHGRDIVRTENEAPENIYAFAAPVFFPSAGHADAASRSAKRACWKIFGECPATESHGNARTAANGMATAINNPKYA